MNKRLAALLCILALLTTSACGAGERTDEGAEANAAVTAEMPPEATEKSILYSDIAGDEWFVSAVDELTQKGIMTGVEEGVFGPYQPVTRATVILVLWRLDGSPEAEVAEPFPDVEPWFATAAAWAKGYGIATGYLDGRCGGRDMVSREQMASFLYRYAQYKGEPLAQGALGMFSDAADISEWAQEAMAHVTGLGIMQGGDGGRLDPAGVTNRAALAVMIQRMLTPVAG